MVDSLHQTFAQNCTRAAIYTVHPFLVVVPFVVLPWGSTIVMGPGPHRLPHKLPHAVVLLAQQLFSTGAAHWGYPVMPQGPGLICSSTHHCSALVTLVRQGRSHEGHATLPVHTAAADAVCVCVSTIAICLLCPDATGTGLKCMNNGW